MGKTQLAILCALPILAIMLVQTAYRKYNEPDDISGCYIANDTAFVVKGGSLIAAGGLIAKAHLRYFKQEPYLTVDPGIDITATPVRIITKERGLSENYPMMVRRGQMNVTITSTDNLQHTFNRQPCGSLR